MRSRRLKGAISPISLKEVYAERGDYIVKMIIDPSLSQVIEGVEVDVRNADGLKMDFSAKRWGTKLTVSFTIDGTTPDGVSVIDVMMRRNGHQTKERFDFWVVKD